MDHPKETLGRQLHLREFGYAVGFVAMFFALYAGMYYALVKPEPAFDTFERGPFNDKGRGRLFYRIFQTPDYRLRGKKLAPYFSPMHSIDRKIRPDVWAERVIEDIHIGPFYNGGVR